MQYVNVLRYVETCHKSGKAKSHVGIGDERSAGESDLGDDPTDTAEAFVFLPNFSLQPKLFLELCFRKGGGAGWHFFLTRF